jgi:hypothetical protein
VSRHFTVNAPAVVAEVIDGEAVIMNLQSGHYFSTSGVGALAWEWLALGHADVDVAHVLAERHPAAASQVRADVARFVDALLAHDLLREATVAAPGEAPAAAAAPAVWSAPVLSAYTDMEDLLLLDPIHDVGPAGWPMPKADPA